MRISKQAAILSITSLIVGVVAVIGIRFATYNPYHVHYHANFLVYVNGQRELFRDPSYYEEESPAPCTLTPGMTPMERVHMHDNVNDVVHVEDHAVTWGTFFQNLRWIVNSSLVQTPAELYIADTSQKVTLMLNGKQVQDISNTVIQDKDRLLVNFGNTDQITLNKEMSHVSSTAIVYDKGTDPATCTSNSEPTLQDRLNHLL